MSRQFDWGSQERFASISGDCNPIHMDAAVARRTHSGAPIVHGIHSLLWLLDCLAEQEFSVRGAKTLKAQFPQPIFVGDIVCFELVESTRSVVRARLMVGAEEVVSASLGFEEMQRPALPIRNAHRECTSHPISPRVLDLEEISGVEGCLLFGPSMPQIGTLFPTAANTFGLRRIEALVSTSCLIGMVVPGLHSLFSGLEVSFCENASEPADALRYSVLSVAARFRLVRIGISGQGLRGSLETVSRMPPIKQAGIDHATRIVAADEFRYSVALIVGGSRGLGELTAKLIAAGGGHVAITYALGKTDAKAVAEELRQTGTKCDVIAYDVRQPAAAQLERLEVPPTHLYYFATPPIFRRKAGLFDAQRFDEFNSFYVTGFFDLVQACLRRQPNGLRIFYPSSSALDSRPANMTEYSMSKVAAEVLCADLARFAPGVKIVTRRLPRLLTDQTSSVVQVKTADPAEVLLPIVREMHQR